jgi:hypothetical protein
MPSGDDYVRVEVDLVFGTADAVKIDVNGESVWVPRSVLFGPEESDIATGNLDGSKSLKMRHWFAKKSGLV